jgi:hypothetical protein
MKSKDQIKLESLYEQVVNELFTGMGISELKPKLEDAGYVYDQESDTFKSPISNQSLSFSDAVKEYEEKGQSDEESSEQSSEEELDTPIEKKADAMLSQGAPQDGMSDQQVKVIEDLLDEKN